MVGRRRVFASTPLLVVSDLERALDFYQRVLGYECPLRAGEPPTFAMLHRDGHDLMLRVGRAPGEVAPNARLGAWDLHLRVADLDAERAAIEAAGVAIHGERPDTEYGMRELEVLDPDGHLVCLGQDHERRPEDAGR